MTSEPRSGRFRGGHRAAEIEGMALGLLAVVIFGLTLPATRIAVREIDPVFATIARALLAAVLSAIVIFVMRSRPPGREEWPRYALYAAGVVLGYPIFMSTAVQFAPASHAGVVLAVQPLLTAMASIFVAGERPSRAFWLVSAAGTLAVVVYSMLSSSGGSGSLHWADLLLAAAAVIGSIGYATGGELSRRRPGWEVVCWTVMLSSPVMAALLVVMRPPVNWGASWQAWLALAYTGVFAMFLGFFAWNKGLALGGIARVGQVQLVQPFVALAGAALLVGERIGWLEIGFALLVVVIVALGSRMRVRR